VILWAGVVAVIVIFGLARLGDSFIAAYMEVIVRRSAISLMIPVSSPPSSPSSPACCWHA